MTKQMDISISLVEDDDGLREEFGELIDQTAGFRMHRTYRNAEEALERLTSEAPDVLLMDINLPGMSGIECVRRLKRVLPELPIVMLTVYEDSDALFDSLMAGANGYLLKRTPRAKLVEALRDLSSGGAPMSRKIARKVVEFFHQAKSVEPRSPELSGLTPREQEILAELAKGRSYKEIATVCGISGDTVRKHMCRIYEKLHVHSRTEAILKYLGHPPP